MHLTLHPVPVVLLLLLLGHLGQSQTQQQWHHMLPDHAAVQAASLGLGHEAAVGPVQVQVPQAAADAQGSGFALGQQPVELLQTDGSLSTAHHTRGLSAATQGRTAPATLAATPRSPLAAGDRCPAATADISTAGCTCTVYRSNSGRDSGGDTIRRVNVCPAGYRCSPSAKEAVLSGIMAGWSLNSSSSSQVTRMGGTVTEQGICVPCQLGEYCPVGTQEETLLSISACGAQSLSISNQTSNSTGSSGTSRASLSSDSCSGVKLCPGGSFCPSAAQQVPCDAGRWCPAGSTKSQPCNITGLLVWNPFAKAPGSSQLILETLVKAAQPLDGNSCPSNATNPLSGCPPGFFCPTAAEKNPCPRGYFCPGATSAPVSCPVLGSCVLEEETTPDWSWLGVALMLLLLAALLLLLEYARVSGRSNRSAQRQEDDVMHLVEAVGFKMVGSHGSYHVSRTARPAEKQHSLHMRISHKASTPSSGPAHSFKESTSIFARALRSASGYQHSHAAGVLPHNGTASGSSNQVTDDAVLDVGVLSGQHKPAAAVDEGLPHAQSNDRVQLNAGTAPASGHTLASQTSMPSPFEVSSLAAAPSSNCDTALPAMAPVKGAADAQDDSSDEYVINPRLTLVFRDVWVADIPIEEGLARGAKRRLLGLCGKDGTRDGRGSSTHAAQTGSGSSSAQRGLVAKLESAAAEGAFFIVPGVSSRFTHSQLHAIMGPSGCGKTTLCKALAGRVPLSRMCGDVRLLCSTAADDFQSEVELAATGSMRGLGAVSNISQMTGFVPQFDQLHESLTVLENLLLAARLRLPVTGKGQGLSASAARHLRRQRHREVHKVVGEVMALMALNKVATTVVGTSSDRTLSGGQRKRVAIAVELVSKPSLLWLDEPTSGLDAAVAYDVLAALKASSERGMNVLAVMHQPRCSIFNMFDSCLLLGSDGNVVYSGPQHLAQSYMAFLGFYIPPNENLADFLLDVTSGVVPRPGDPDYMPSHLAAIWHKAGNIWVDKQLRKMQQLQPTTSDDLVDLLPVPPAVDSPVDWPWRPRDLEALLARFDLLVDSGADAQVFGRERFARMHREQDTPSVLTYDGFIGFWDESGIQDLLGEEYADFMAGLCDEFELKPGGTITRARFVEVLKAQLRAAAAAAEGVSTEQLCAAKHGGLSAASAGSDADTPFAQGVLTGPQARLRQHTFKKQQTLQRQLSQRPEGSGGSVAGVRGRAAMGQPQMQALSRWKKAQQAATTAAVLNARLHQLKNAPHSAASLQPCASVQEARARGLDQLADYLVMEASQQVGQLDSRNASTSASSSTTSSLPQQLASGGAKLPPALTRVTTLLEVDTLPSEDVTNPSSVADVKPTATVSAKGASAAAAAAVSSRKLPSLPKQLELIMLRCSWKAVLSRSALMTDLLLTSLLGLALGIAQGRNIQPGSSQLWMLITLLAYGSISLVRSTRSYGNERHLYLQQESPAGVSVTAWVFGHQIFDMVGLMLHPLLFFAWIYVLTLTPVPAWSYFTTLVVVGFYTSGMGYLVSLSVNAHNAMIAGLAVALLLGGVANGIVPSMWQLASSHPLLWLDQLSYTRWGLQALYISWLTPAPAVQAPATATFLSSLGFCGLDPALLQALKGRNSGWDAAGSSGIALNSTAVGGQQLWNMTSAQRSTAMAQAAAANLRDSPAASKSDAAAAAAITQLWQYYNHPRLLNDQCNAARGTAVAVLVVLGVVCRLSVWVLVKVKVARKAQQ